MKRFFVLLLLFAVIIVSCAYDDAVIAEGNGMRCFHKWRGATCTVAAMCMICGKAEGTSLGHTTNCGKCTRCGLQITEILGAGDTCFADGSWEFTVDSATVHYACNSYSKRNNYPQYILVTYSYKIYAGSSDIEISSESIYVYDRKRRAAVLYPCIHAKKPKIAEAGKLSEGNQAAFALHNLSDEVKLVLVINTAKRKHRAVYYLGV
jgi:hypothetical protein